MIIVKRTFEAAKFPKGSEERTRLNADWLTSEYMTSYRYGLRNDDGSHTPYNYRTKGEALAALQGVQREAPQEVMSHSTVMLAKS